ncbi:MAG: class I SAM-dependent methyltransferase [Pseudomonadota bacterium]|nr:class I SAM-dependent methyltransferase [Pseudomonadota bacterium]
MSSKTQETSDYFNNNTEFWSSLFNKSIYGTATQRVRIVANKLRGLIENSNNNNSKCNFTHLDFGCGTGELAAISASMGIQVVAIDVAPAMVEVTLSSINTEFTDNVKVMQGDVSSLKDVADGSIDAFSALGLIEYLTLDELDVFLHEVARILRPHGKAYIGSRNRLFNIYSDNEFTSIEKGIGEYSKLCSELDAIGEWTSDGLLIESLNDRTKIRPFSNWKYPELLPSTSPVSVSQRIQYSVSDLSMRLIDNCLMLNDIKAVRFHPANLAVLDPARNVELIDKVNLVIDEYDDTKWAIPYSSSFILEVSR